jgi:hypothetical protein
VLSLTSKSLTLGFTTPGLIRSFQNGSNEDVLKEALQVTLGLDVSVELVVGQQAQPAAEAPAAYEGLAPGDEIEPVDPEAPQQERPVLGEDAALALVQDQLGGRVIDSGRP